MHSALRCDESRPRGASLERTLRVTVLPWTLARKSAVTGWLVREQIGDRIRLIDATHSIRMVKGEK
jgi:hypothetical protein